jgi:hypothetical protein
MKYMILPNGEYAEGIYIPEGAKLINSPRPSHAHKLVDDEWVFQGYSEEEAFVELRDQRNLLLFETDWWGASDQTMTDEQKDYREKLRSLPSTAKPSLDENRKLTGVTWPEKPE